MATSFHQGSSEIQASAEHGGLHTLYLMNPNYVPISFSDTSTHHLVGIPLPTVVRSNNNSDDYSRPISFDQTDPSPHASFTPPRLHYNLWGPLDQTPAMSPTTTSAHQHLSLSLSSHHQHQGYNSNYMSSPPQTSGDDLRVFPRNSWSVSVSALSNGFSGVQSVLLGSKYLKAVQEILDEVVNVGKGTNAASLDSGIKGKLKIIRESTATIGASTSSGGDQSNAKQGAELTTAQRQEFQMKKSKLVRMLDEVEHKYRQYHHQMQFVINSFEQAACFGSAKAYTDLALRTISKQFRSLKDTISRHIKATSKNLGEGECLGAKIEGSRLRYADHHIRQQRSLQQLGMVQQNAWRPQRGLPGRAVSVLRAWLFEHFLHPYPKDSDKVMLAKQAGLTRSQVSNWFINARVRLWKPMVEEMYLEETKEQEKNVSKNKRKESTSTTPQKSASIRSLDDEQMNNFWPRPEKFSNQHPSTNEMPSSSLLRSPIGGSLQSHSSCNLVGMSSMPESPKKPKSSEIENSPTSHSVDNTEMKASETSRGIATNYGSGFGTYPIADIERFNMNSEQLALGFHGHGTSLTLGLPYCESFSLPNHGQISFHDQLRRRLEMGIAGEADFLGNQPSTTFS